MMKREKMLSSANPCFRRFTLHVARFSGGKTCHNDVIPTFDIAMFHFRRKNPCLHAAKNSRYKNDRAKGGCMQPFKDGIRVTTCATCSLIRRKKGLAELSIFFRFIIG